MLRAFDAGSSDAGAFDRAAELPTDDLVAEDRSVAEDPGLTTAEATLRSLVLAVERYRTEVSTAAGLGSTESSALTHLVTHGDRGQSDLARELGLTSSAATALVDRLERHGVAERVRHPNDRRRMIIRLTARGELLAERTHQPLRASLAQVGPGDLAEVSRWLGAIADGLGAVRPGTA